MKKKTKKQKLEARNLARRVYKAKQEGLGPDGVHFYQKRFKRKYVKAMNEELARLVAADS